MRVSSAFLLLLVIPGCSRDYHSLPPPDRIIVERAPLVQEDDPLDESGVLTWADPPGWRRSDSETPIRLTEYVIPRADGDGEDAKCSVYTFGMGGSAEANVKRWIGQFDPNAASAPDEKAYEVGGMKVNEVEMSGTLQVVAPGTHTPEARVGYRLLAAAVKGPGGLWYFKMTGPSATVERAAVAFREMLNSLAKST